ncbi:hypothetical protein CSV67_02215 [Sporosarcina sp. P2]|uniref:nuclease-related domain-containing protein n=1 Tax=Sporosarcina sp. P2 TaxID=2048251 RepID=UPI000C1700A6|nr:nuclease-related domain-containing protein [Sporosarcina sp. P2]PID04302.1 hypothetical protein CSV67_02215 [Sporosarcina sp. P2]
MAIVYGRELLEEGLEVADGQYKIGLKGELKVLNSLEKVLSSNAVLVAKPNIGEYEPDLLILQPNLNFILAEVKNTSLSSIKAIQSNGLIECHTYQMNPTEQVKYHRDQLQHFVYAVTKKDVYRNIGHCVVFPSISRSEFQKKFQSTFTHWKNSDVNIFFKYHLFQEDLWEFSKWEGCFKFKPEVFALNEFDIFSLLNKMKPRKHSKFSLNILNAEAIRTLVPLRPVFSRMEEVDVDETNFIRETIQSLVHNAMITSENAISVTEGLLSLKNLRMELSHELTPYVNKANELTQMENKLITEGRVITESFKMEVEKELKSFFDKQTRSMQSEIEIGTKWHSTLTDSTKKASGLVLKGTKHLLSMNEHTKSAANRLSSIDSRTLIEHLLENFLSSAAISTKTGLVIKSASKKYEDKWKEIIDEYSYYVTQLASEKSNTVTRKQLNNKHSIGTSEQVLGLTLGSAVIGTVGLAAGWHTLTYAALNVFPPIAFFAAIATVTTGIVTKNHVIETRKQEVKNAADTIYSHVMKELNPPRTVSRKNALFTQVDETSNLYTLQAVKQGTEQLLGNLSLDHYRDLIHGFQQFDQLLQEALVDLECQLQVKETV